MPFIPPEHKASERKFVQVKKKRPKTSEQGYGWRWQQARLVHLRHEPLCRECLKQGRAVEGVEVDHITPHKGNQELFWRRSNWATLCKPCHSRKTARENCGFGNPGLPK